MKIRLEWSKVKSDNIWLDLAPNCVRFDQAPLSQPCWHYEAGGVSKWNPKPHSSGDCSILLPFCSSDGKHTLSQALFCRSRIGEERNKNNWARGKELTTERITKDDKWGKTLQNRAERKETLMMKEAKYCIWGREVEGGGLGTQSSCHHFQSTTQQISALVTAAPLAGFHISQYTKWKASSKMCLLLPS